MHNTKNQLSRIIEHHPTEKPTEQPLEIVGVTIMNGIKAKDFRGNEYNISTITLGVGSNRRAIIYDNQFLKEKTQCRAEILINGKLNII